MGIALEWESVSDVFDEFQELFDTHYIEIYGKKEAVLKTIFAQMEAMGAIYLLTARDDGKPIGYYAMSLSPSVYIPTRMEAKELGIYVTPEYRKQGITTTMQDVMDETLRKEGVHSVYVSYPYESNIPLNKGYTQKEITYERTL
jgi:GNAT superfamily N-acetyltransferase